MGDWSAQNSSKEFEKLIRDAIAVLIKRGEIKISRKKPFPANQQKEKRQRPTSLTRVQRNRYQRW
jgi:hypothetical protein